MTRYNGKTARQIQERMRPHVFLDLMQKRKADTGELLPATKNFKSIAERYGFWDGDLMRVVN